MNREENGTIEIDLSRLVQFYLKNWKKILAVSVVTGLFAALFTMLCMTPMYRSRATIYVNNTTNVQTDVVTGSNLSASIHLAKTYVNIIKSKPVLEEVIRTGKLDCSAEKLYEKIHAEQIEETEIFVVSAVDPDPELAAHIVNTVAQVAPARIAEIIEGSSAKIVESAYPAKAPYTPNIKKNTVLGILLGGLAVLFLMTLKYLFNMRLETEADIVNNFGLPVLGAIPEMEDSDNKANGGRYTGYSLKKADKR